MIFNSCRCRKFTGIGYGKVFKVKQVQHKKKYNCKIVTANGGRVNVNFLTDSNLLKPKHSRLLPMKNTEKVEVIQLEKTKPLDDDDDDELEVKVKFPCDNELCMGKFETFEKLQEHKAENNCFVDIKEDQKKQLLRMWYNNFQIDSVENRATVRTHMELLGGTDFPVSLLPKDFAIKEESMGYAQNDPITRTILNDKQKRFVYTICEEGRKDSSKKLDWNVVHKKMREYTIDGVKVFTPKEYLTPLQLKNLFSNYIANVKKGKFVQIDEEAPAEEVEEVSKDLENVGAQVDTNELLEAIEADEQDSCPNYHPLDTKNVSFCKIAADFVYKNGKGSLRIDRISKGDLINALEAREIPLPDVITKKIIAQMIVNFVKEKCPDDCLKLVEPKSLV